MSAVNSIYFCEYIQGWTGPFFVILLRLKAHTGRNHFCPDVYDVVNVTVSLGSMLFFRQHFNNTVRGEITRGQIQKIRKIYLKDI